MLGPTPSLLDQYLTISRLLAGQLDFHSVIRAVAAEVSHIIPHDHMDVCIIMLDGKYHTAHESPFETGWGRNPPAPISNSPIRSLLYGEVGTMITDDACEDPRFHYEGSYSAPIFEGNLHARLHVPLKVQGKIIGALRAAEQARASAIVEAEARAREEGLRLGALRLTEALEAERQRIGMDLHDQTLADLTRLSRKLEKLANTATVSGEALDPIIRSVQHCMHDVRQIIEEARPTVLQLFGFAQAVENHLERSVRDSGATIDWTIADETAGIIDALPQSVATALFRIVQEAINNAIRHASASRITVDLRATPVHLRIAIRDDGTGIAPDEKRQGAGIGNMRTRARLISARFEVVRNRDADGTMAGTSVEVSLPISQTAPLSGPRAGSPPG
jgi:signal transduction histidine kinase